MGIIIRQALPEDAEGFLELLKQVGGETDNLTFSGEGVPFTVQEEKEMLEKVLNSESQIFLVAEKNGKIVGNASYTGFTNARMAHRGEFGISVLKSEWGQGIGSMLLEKIIDFAKNTAQAEIISLEVRSDNERAIGLYKKFGFQKIGEFKGFFKIDGEYIDFTLMNLYL